MQQLSLTVKCVTRVIESSVPAGGRTEGIPLWPRSILNASLWGCWRTDAGCGERARAMSLCWQSVGVPCGPGGTDHLVSPLWIWMRVTERGGERWELAAASSVFTLKLLGTLTELRPAAKANLRGEIYNWNTQKNRSYSGNKKQFIIWWSEEMTALSDKCAVWSLNSAQTVKQRLAENLSWASNRPFSTIEKPRGLKKSGPPQEIKSSFDVFVFRLPQLLCNRQD